MAEKIPSKDKNSIQSVKDNGRTRDKITARISGIKKFFSLIILMIRKRNDRNPKMPVVASSSRT